MEDETRTACDRGPARRRRIYDIDASKLPPLPAASDEARAVAAAFGASRSTLLIGESASEAEVKHLRLSDYRVLHFAVHGITSTKSPARSALLLRPGGAEDGLLQAREILTMPYCATTRSTFLHASCDISCAS